jgi:hypothetical protein
MLIREDFITNSSSTNFILSKLMDNTGDKVRLTYEVDMTPMIDKRLRTVEDIKKYMRDDYWYNDDDIIDDESQWDGDAKKMLEAIRSGREILICSASDDARDSIERAICNMGVEEIDTPGWDVIKNGGGY